MLKETGNRQRESVPFTVRTADGDTIELTYSSPRRGRDARRGGGARVATVVRARQAAAQLHAPRDRLLRRGRADLGTTLGRRGHRDAARGTRLAARPRTRSDPSTRRSGSTTTRAPPAMPTSAVCRRSSTSTTRCSPANGVRVNYIEAPVPAIGAYGYIKNLVTLAGGGLVVHGGAILHRYGLGSWQRGREVIWAKALAALQVPIYLTIHGTRHLRARRRPLARREDVRLQRVASSRTRRACASSSSCSRTSAIELIVSPQPRLVRLDRRGNIGTSHMDMVMLTLDEREVAARAASRELRLRARADQARLPDHRGAASTSTGTSPLNGVTLAPGKVVMNARLADRRRRRSSAHDVEVIQVDFSESHRFAIAGLHCATLELVRDQMD